MDKTDSLADIAALLSASDTIAICGHHNPDGDCIGCVCALTHLLRKMGKDAQPLFCADEEIPDIYRFLVDSDQFVRADDYDKNPDVFIALDVSGRKRIKKAGDVLERATRKLVVDHHPGPDDIWDVCYDDPSAAAAGMLVWELAELLGVVPDPEFATACYVATMTDTGRFQFQNTDARALRTAATFCDAGANPAEIATKVYQQRTLASIKLETRAYEHLGFANDGRIAYTWVSDEDIAEFDARKQDTDNLIDRIRALGGIKVAFLLRVSGENIRGSIRAKDDTDVSAIATKMGGGGHRAASGFTLTGKLELAIKRVLDACKDV